MARTCCSVSAPCATATTTPTTRWWRACGVRRRADVATLSRRLGGCSDAEADAVDALGRELVEFASARRAKDAAMPTEDVKDVERPVPLRRVAFPSILAICQGADACMNGQGVVARWSGAWRRRSYAERSRARSFSTGGASTEM
jgi:hypothetical protein